MRTYCIHRWLNTWIAYCVAAAIFSLSLSTLSLFCYRKTVVRIVGTYSALDLILQNGRWSCCYFDTFFFLFFLLSSPYACRLLRQKQSSNILDDVDINTCRVLFRCIVNSKWRMIMTMIETNDWQHDEETQRACETFNTWSVKHTEFDPLFFLVIFFFLFFFFNFQTAFFLYFSLVIHLTWWDSTNAFYRNSFISIELERYGISVDSQTVGCSNRWAKKKCNHYQVNYKNNHLRYFNLN